jgi:agmatine deiminase
MKRRMKRAGARPRVRAGKAREAPPDPPPAALGFRMPAEWEPHAATWIAWPHEERDWPGKLAPIDWVYGEFVRHVAVGERVRILAHDAAVEKRARALLKRVGVDKKQVEFLRAPTDRSWTRDYCPLFVTNRGGEVAATNWRFTGWAKYANHKRDDAVNDRIIRHDRRRHWEPTAQIGKRVGKRVARVVLEGGAIDVNGTGTLLATEECLLDEKVQARNPGLGREALEEVLGSALGVRKVLWLGRGIAGDDTHGHVDDLARFVDETTVVVAQASDPDDVNYEPLRENRARLEGMTIADGRPLRVVSLPMPEPLFLDGVRLPASYANFYIANEAVLVPTFNDPNDRLALNMLAGLFPTRRVVGIHAVDLVWGFGTLHCMTQQEPAGGAA